MKLDLRVGKEGFAPSAKFLPSFLELVEQPLVGLCVTRLFIPSITDHSLEARHFDPVVFEAEGPRSPRTVNASKQKGTVVGQG